MKITAVPLPPLAEFAKRCAREIDEALIWTDLVGTMVWANRRAETLFGYPEKELLGRPVMMLYSPSNPFDLGQEIVRDTMAGGWRGDIQNVAKSGEEFPCQMTTTLIRDAAGAPLGIAGALIDLRRFRDREAKLVSEAAAGRSLLVLLGGATGDAAARALAEGTGLEGAALLEGKDRIAGYAGDPFLRDHVAGGARAIGARCWLEGAGRRGRAVAFSLSAVDVSPSGRAFFDASLKILL